MFVNARILAIFGRIFGITYGDFTVPPETISDLKNR